MDESFSSPKPISSEKALTCPPTPRRCKPSTTFDDRHVLVPFFFPNSCSILGTIDSKVIEINDDPAHISSRQASDFTLKNRANSEVPSRKILIKDFPNLPFYFPARTNQAPFVHPSSMTIPRSSSDPNKLRPFQRRTSSIADVERRHTSLNARCA
eukprot:CAMPEP_0172330686 /NCGR_PEP_ID=MMETSP1058-20130122/61533_1 /TAXON_ID=83371 /ORGANISM="Detonula confervacea, Strain CCMP 353" /LENGTH=154 /DNA_ID=CAMNT_0013047911 /DNA_START=1351 /DNA_END=1815 /DNA_ORIENTATION=+